MIFGRWRKRAWCILLFATCLFFLSASVHALDVPPLKGYINDYADMISPSARAQLENELKAFEQSDSTQIVILTIPSLEGEVIEEYGIKVAEAWKIGQKGKDNGVIFLVAKQDRKMRIEVGRGLEGKLTDLTAGRIVDLVVKPRFKRGDFDGGVVSGVHAVIDATRGEFKAEEQRHVQKRDSFSSFLSLLIFGSIVILILGNISRVLGGIAGAVGLPLLAVSTFASGGLIAIVILAVAGLAGGIFLPLLFSSGRHGSWPGGGFFMGGGGFGGGDFGGGFSGGGGDFGGGGASGGW